ncbi:hypothetical protein PEM37_27795 [Streptomyces sp. AD681]|uniref:hypothetical protein n=1 Tax=Streptomyces sp. AD681 TaxID=3019069 RepID=UPI0022F16012|nr:hypothetical protein [Streptomyces sp. AD681]MDA5145316.1 hypothetical protein [Streptomyces sp. AD681]
MSAPVHRTSERPSVAALTSARERREEGRTGSSSGSRTSAEQALLGLQSSAGNRAASATVQRARGRTLERTPGTDTDRPGSAPGGRRDPAGRTRRGSESGTQGMDVDPALQEQATSARRAALTARFPPSGRTRRGSDTDTRPGPGGLARRGSESGTQGMEADPALREQATAARRAAEERAAAEEAAETRRRVRAGGEAAAATARNRNTAKRAASEAAAKGARLLEEAEAAAAEAAEVERRRRAGAEAAAAKARERIAAAEAAAAEEDRLRRAAEVAAAEEARRRRLEEEAAVAHTAVEEEEEAHTAVEEVTLTPEERAARDARIADLVARFPPSDRTRRGSDAGIRREPAELTRRGSESGLRHVEVGTGPWERIGTTATEEPAPPAETVAPPAEEAAPPAETVAPPAEEEEARRAEERAAADTRAEVRSDRLKAVAENADQGKRILDPTDALGKGVQAPTAAGLGQDATAAAASAPKDDAAAAAQAAAQTHDASAAGVSGASLSGLTELLSGAASVADSFRNLRTALSKGSGAGYHNAHKKGKTKATDAGMSVASTGANAGTIAKEAVKLQGVGSTVASAEASGVLSGVAGVAKAVRAAFKSKGAIAKIHGLRQLQKHNAAQSQRLLRLEAEANTAELNARFAREAVARARDDREGRTEEEWAADLRTAGAAYERTALIEARAKADFLSLARDLEDLNFATDLAKSRQVSKVAKEMGGGVMGEGLKGAGGVATVAIAATVGLASNPAGWITAAVGAGLVLTTAAYKGGSAAYGRFQEAHHPELYTPEGEPIPTAKDTGDSLLHAMKFWKKITKYKRQLAAHKIYNMISREGTDPALRASALQLLILIKAGPENHNLQPAEWEARLMNPAEKADVIKEITDQLASS